MTVKVRIETLWCKRCGICVEFCPKQVFMEGELNEPIVVNEEACNVCRLCELRCPEFAIMVVENAQSRKN
jgi:2-oxoglutarate ferredoxin oxidoreductase subunit delta